MAKRRFATASAGDTRKSHKTRKTTPATESAGEPSLTAPVTTPTPPVPDNVALALLGSVAADMLEKSKDAMPVLDVPREEPAKQWWYRPADSKARKIAEKIVVMREAGRSDADIAKKLKTTEGSVRQYIYLARKNGWLGDDDEPVDLELELALTTDRKVVRNISASLDGQMTNWQTHEMTIAAAKGRGIFKNHETGKQDQGPAMQVVAIQVVMPPVGAGDQQRQITDGEMGGVPAYIEGDVEESDGS